MRFSPRAVVGLASLVLRPRGGLRWPVRRVHLEMYAANALRAMACGAWVRTVTIRAGDTADDREDRSSRAWVAPGSATRIHGSSTPCSSAPTCWSDSSRRRQPASTTLARSRAATHGRCSSVLASSCRTVSRRAPAGRLRRVERHVPRRVRRARLPRGALPTLSDRRHVHRRRVLHGRQGRDRRSSSLVAALVVRGDRRRCPSSRGDFVVNIAFFTVAFLFGSTDAHTASLGPRQPKSGPTRSSTSRRRSRRSGPSPTSGCASRRSCTTWSPTRWA